ncbi:MAG: M16 family metallopeptidase [Deltaproteobacteria bacterium]
MLMLATLAASLAFAAPPPPYQQKVLSDGLTLLVVQDHALPLVTVEIGVRAGSMVEDPSFNGVSHLYEHMFFKGNQVIPNQEAYLARIRELGMVFNGSTETERVNYFFTTTSDELGPSLSLMRDSIEHPLFDPKELAREEKVVVGEIDRDESDPGYHFKKALDDRLWKLPSYKDPLGNRKTVLGATPEMLRTLQARYYVPNNAVLVVAGDVRPAAVFAEAERLFADWGVAPDPFVAHPLVREPPLDHSSVVVVPQPVRTVSLAFEWQGPSVVGKEIPATYAADLLSAMVERPGSQFQQALVDSGACVRADLSWYTQKNIGPVSFGLEAAPDRVDRCVQAALAELPKLAEAGAFSPDDFKDGITRLEVERAQEEEVPSSYSHVLTFWWSSSGLDYYEGYLGGLRGVTQKDIGDFLHGFVLGRPFVFGAMLSPRLVGEGLDAAHFEKLLGLTQTEAAR